MEAKQTASKGSFTELALEILDLALKLDSQLASQGRKQTTFEFDTLRGLPVEINATREEFINKTQTAKRLALGAGGILRELVFQFTDEMTLRAIYDFRLAQHVPLNEPATFEEIAQASELDSPIVERILRHAMTNHIFSEAPGEPSGRVVHTAASRLLATNPDALAAVGMLVKDFAPISVHVNEAIIHWRDLPASERDEPTQAATALLHGPGQTYFGLLKKDEARAARFAGGMQYFAEGTEEDVKLLLAGYPWNILDRQGAILVDIGGGTGGPARVLAAGTHHLQVVVQDLPGPTTKGAQTLLPTLASRVVFEAHDFFEPQPRRDVDAFYLRWILHNWSDKNALRILKALVPGMKHGTRVIINEYVLKGGPETRFTRKHHRNLDLLMLAVWNAKERTEAKWKEIIEAVDSRLRFKGTRKIEGSVLCIIEAVWEEPSTKFVDK
ncbi:putative O-methyltransferase [Daldinia decipiens]|uniref:putative O-methyltransferase n=1 Tax=Daldinia decipiens TaxID=326647 RepID=UPI0020C22530|nr:putative O-methyltransferase [Daldinia decipiens]KAI1656461.1 putative O-methyltransferase [Daldinia decipiens]